MPINSRQTQLFVTNNSITNTSFGSYVAIFGLYTIGRGEKFKIFMCKLLSKRAVTHNT